MVRLSVGNKSDNGRVQKTLCLTIPPELLAIVDEQPREDRFAIRHAENERGALSQCVVRFALCCAAGGPSWPRCSPDPGRKMALRTRNSRLVER
jgi:hypothetical protein